MSRLVFSLMCLGVVPGFSATGESSFPLFFVQNAGMADASVRYIVETSEMRAAFASDSATFFVLLALMTSLDTLPSQHVFSFANEQRMATRGTR